MKTVTHFVDPLIACIFIACFGVFLVVYERKKSTFVFWGTYVLATLFFVLGFKNFFEIARPVGGLITETGYSFPSGHASFSVVIALMIYTAVSDYFVLSEKKQRILGVVLGFYVALISYSRIYLGVHRLEDVIFGASLSFLLFVIVQFKLRARQITSPKL